MAKEKWKSLSAALPPHGRHSPWNSPGQNTGAGSLSLLEGICPTQGSNPGLPLCRWILYQLSYQGSQNKQNLKITFRVILGGLSLQRLESGLGWEPGSWPLDQLSVTRALALRLCKEFTQRWEVVKQVFMRMKKSACVDRQEWTQSRWDLTAVWITFTGRFLWVSFGQSFWLTWFTVHIWYISGSFHVCTRVS